MNGRGKAEEMAFRTAIEENEKGVDFPVVEGGMPGRPREIAAAAGRFGMDEEPRCEFDNPTDPPNSSVPSNVTFENYPDFSCNPRRWL